jgi:hypothetical protein
MISDDLAVSGLPPRVYVALPGAEAIETLPCFGRHTVKIDDDACSGPRRLCRPRPEVFAVDDVARVIGTDPDDLLLAAPEVCPSTAIQIVDQQTGEQIYPRRPSCESW